MIRLSKSTLNDDDKEAVNRVLDSEFLGMGPEVKDFEDKLTDYFSRKVTCVSSGTSALQLALESAGITTGDEVLVQSLTYVASFQAISATGAIPIACDIQDDMTICLDDAAKKITTNTKAIMPVHYSGGVGDLDKIYKFGQTKKLRVIEDAAHAFGSSYKGKLVGSFGDISCFSFDGIKNITSGEGGCIVSDDKKIHKMSSDLRLLGVEGDTINRFKKARSWDFDVNHQGWRYHMSDLMAALGSSQLNRFSESAKTRQNLAKYYNRRLEDTGLITVMAHDYSEVVPHIYPILLNCPVDRDDLRFELEKLGIQTGLHYKPNHHLSFYKTQEILEKTEEIHSKLMTLPLHLDLTEKDIDFICENLLDLLKIKIDATL